jgi:hypothetical protein
MPSLMIVVSSSDHVARGSLLLEPRNKRGSLAEPSTPPSRRAVLPSDVLTRMTEKSSLLPLQRKLSSLRR